jgi:glycosyltransferase involved in cell wall biosynthesis
VAVFPSYRDFASLSPIEAVACGVPVVLSRRLFHAEYLERLGCARASGDDPDEFGRAVADLLDQYGRQGLDPVTVAPVVERFALSSGARRMLAYMAERAVAGDVGVETP